MCKEIRIEYLLGSALSNKTIERLPLKELSTVESKLISMDSGYFVDISNASLYSAISVWNDYFQIEKDCVVLVDSSIKTKKNVRQLFFDTLDKKSQGMLMSSIDYLTNSQEKPSECA
jgi:hypothetical protein